MRIFNRWFNYEPPSLCHADGDPAPAGGDATNGAGGANGAGATGPSGVASAPAQPNWAEFVSGLQTSINDTLGPKLDAIVGEIRPLSTALTTPPPADPPDFEAMSRPELVAHIVGTVGEAVRAQIAEALGPLAQQVGQIQQNITTTSVSADIASMRGEHKDFQDWKDEMVGIAREHPTLGVRDLYQLARSRNPTKADELNKKYAPPAQRPPPRWGGLLPNGTGGSPAAPVSAREAGEAAYREVSARHPGVLAALENM